MRDNKILYNYKRIHAYMQRVGDGGGIYTLSNQKHAMAASPTLTSHGPHNAGPEI
jgi:hypothetical protein